MAPHRSRDASKTRADDENREQAEQKLQESEERYRLLFERNLAGVLVSTPDGQVLDCNEALVQILGYDSRAHVLAHRAWDFYDDAADRQAFLAELHEKRSLTNHELRCRRQDGRPVWVVTNVTLLETKIGNVVFSTLSDISERKRAEEALRHHERQVSAELAAMTRLQEVSTRLVQSSDTHALLSDVVDAAIAITAADMGNIQMFDRLTGALKVVAHRGFDAPFLDFFNAVHEGEAACGTALRTGERVVIEDVATSPVFVGTPALAVMLAAGARAVQSTPLVCRYGRRVGMLSTHYRTPRRPTERDLRLLDLLARQAADWIERLQAEEALRESEARLRLFIKHAPAAIAMFDQEMRYLAVSSRWLADYRLSDSNILGRSHYKVFPEVPERWKKVYARCLEGAVERCSEDRFDRTDGRLQWLQWEVRPWRTSSGAVGGIVVFTEDITGRKRAEEEHRKLEAQILHTQKLESLGVLAGGIAHDFNNILTGILGYIDLARLDLPADSATRRLMEEAAKNAHRAAGLTRQMLAYSGKGRFVVLPLNLSKLVKETTRLLEISVSKKCSLTYDLAVDLPPCEADATQMGQILMNLVINASEAIEDQNGVISVTTGTMRCDRAYLAESYLDENLPAGLYVFIEVTDTGCGMTPETQSKIFDPFFSTKFTGRGLGLAAVLGIVRGHRGAIKVYSELGKGSAFKALFPASVQPIIDEKASITVSENWRAEGITALIVDDEEIVRDLARDMLEKMGFNVLAAADGHDGVEVFRANADRIRLVLLDLMMPRLDGIESFREMRRIRRDLCALLSSGYNEQTATSRFVGKGLAGFIQKPYSFEQLRIAVKKALDSHELNSADIG